MNKDISILAIETSCDETACAVVKNGKEVLSNVVSSQINTHSKFGGVIPEVAARLHVENITFVMDEALALAKIPLDEIDGIAVTYGPGLIGCLHIGLQAAKTLCFLHNRPLIGVNHLAGHIYANSFITDFKFPLLSLVVSGGHSELVYMPDEYTFDVIGSTCDDAIGEAYDKVARLLNLGYPGGPIIDNLAKKGELLYDFPIVKVNGKYDFSFSGLKSATIQLLKRLDKDNQSYKIEDIACSFQNAVLTQLVEKAKRSLDDYQVNQFILAGGVAANSRLRQLVQTDLQEIYKDIEMIIPPIWCCTDNAAMIAAAGYVAFKKGLYSDYYLSANPSLSL